MPDTNKRDYAAQRPAVSEKPQGRSPSSGGKTYPATPHEFEGKYEKCVGQQAKNKKF